MSSYARALRRLWWVVAIGLVVSVAAAYKVVTGNDVTYQASTRLLVTSNDDPYLRTAIQRSGEALSDDGSTSVPYTYFVVPDVRTLVQAANLYPLFIESDDVARVRTEMFGALPGGITARGIGATATLNRQEPGDFPVIEIIGVASQPGLAVELTRSTADAFIAWLARTQDESGVAEGDRILIEQLQVPTSATTIGEESLGLAIGVGVAFAVAFGLLAILLDRIVPRRRSERGPPEVGALRLRARRSSSVEEPTS